MTDHIHYCVNIEDLAGRICGSRGFCLCECGAIWTSATDAWTMPSTEEEYKSQSGDDVLAQVQQQARAFK